jgi:hypothetical protein
MTTLAGNYFTLSDFDKLIQGYTQSVAGSKLFVLDDSVLKTIAFLNKNIEVPDFPAYVPRVVDTARVPFEKESYKPKSVSRKRDNVPSASPSNDNWELMRSFKTTKMETKTGVDKSINDIRVHLNKMSTANYAKQRDTIMEEIRKYADDEENITKIASTIFDIASGNKFFSELYAELYRELISHFAVFSDILAKFVATFPDTIHGIEYIDADADYDGFCRVTKQNDKRKATTTFIANVMKKGLVLPESVLAILSNFMETILQWTGEPDRVHQIEEVAENIFILVSLGCVEFREYPQWVSCVDTITRITNKTQPQTSMSNRALFKFMDMVVFTKSK